MPYAGQAGAACCGAAACRGPAESVSVAGAANSKAHPQSVTSCRMRSGGRSKGESGGPGQCMIWSQRLQDGCMHPGWSRSCKAAQLAGGQNCWHGFLHPPCIHRTLLHPRTLSCCPRSGRWVMRHCRCPRSRCKPAAAGRGDALDLNLQVIGARAPLRHVARRPQPATAHAPKLHEWTKLAD